MCIRFGEIGLSRFIQGVDREQVTLFPESLDEYIDDDNPVRAIDVFIDALNLVSLGFQAEPAQTGRPSYHPGVLLKIYLYGYLNQIHSSRRLERETQRNVELMWLTGRLSPDFKTIADFRRDNGQGIRQVCKQFVNLCREIGLFAQSMVAIDGSKFKAVNAHDRNFTKGKVAKQINQVDECIDRYLSALDTADRQSPEIAEARTKRLAEKIQTMRQKLQRLKSIESQLAEGDQSQVSLTDPDSRAMATSTSRGLVGYNVQSAVDTTHHLIVAHEVSNSGSDRSQLAGMARLAKQAMQVDNLDVIADRGYFNGEEIVACEESGITPLVSKPHTSSAKAEGRFDKEDFVFDAQQQQYRCPAGSWLKYRFTSDEKGGRIHRYWSSDCPSCPIRDKCTPSSYRRISRYDHEESLERMQRRMDLNPELMRIRRATVEHPFGTLKHWMGASHFLTRGLDRVRTEMSLHVLAYNMRRMLNIMGVKGLIEAINA